MHVCFCCSAAKRKEALKQERIAALEKRKKRKKEREAQELAAVAEAHAKVRGRKMCCVYSAVSLYDNASMCMLVWLGSSANDVTRFNFGTGRGYKASV